MLKKEASIGASFLIFYSTQILFQILEVSYIDFRFLIGYIEITLYF